MSDTQDNKKHKIVEIPKYSNIPRWLVLQGEIDLRLFILDKMLDDDKRKIPINRMIDEATGFDKQLEQEAQELIQELRWLKKEFDKEQS